MKKKIIICMVIEIIVLGLSFLLVLTILSILLYDSNFALGVKDERLITLFLFTSLLTSISTFYTLFKLSKGREKKIVSGLEQDKEIMGNLENSAFMSKEDMDASFKTLEFSALKNEEMIGLPIKAKEDKDYLITLAPISHTLVIGTTGSGKTTSFINPTIQVLSNLKSKPSLIIGDVKGELLKLHRKSLEERGYKIMVLDLRNPFESTKWNPLDTTFDIYQEMSNLDNEITHIDDKYFYKDKTYLDREGVKKDVEVDKRKLYDEVYENLNDITSAICPVDSKEDPTWEKGARNFVLAIELAMLEDSALYKPLLSKEQFNFYNIYMIATSNDENCKRLMQYFDLRPSESRARALSKQVLIGADKTRDSYLTTVYSKLSMFADMGVCNLTSKNEMDIESLQDSPIALFLEIPDEKETRHSLASLFISQAYKSLVQASRKNKDLRLNRDVVFILDEFGNLPKIDKLSQMVTVGRSRRIHFIFVVQSYTQLDNVYGERVSEIVKSNCNIQVFIGTTDQKTCDEFSKRCGNMSILTRSYSTSTKDENEFSSSTQLTQRPIIYPSELQRLNHDGDMGHAIVTVFGHKPIKSFYTPSYLLNSYRLEGGDEEKESREVFNEKEVLYTIDKRIAYGEEKKISEFEEELELITEKEGKKYMTDLKYQELKLRDIVRAFIVKKGVSGMRFHEIYSLVVSGDYDGALKLINQKLKVFDKYKGKQFFEEKDAIETMLNMLVYEIKIYQKLLREEEAKDRIV